jgi:hypothetical protein
MGWENTPKDMKSEIAHPIAHIADVAMPALSPKRHVARKMGNK